MTKGGHNMGLIVGNLFSLFGMVADGVSSSRKTARGMLLVQCLGQLLYSVSAIALKGYSAAVQNVVSIFRNLAAIRKVSSKAVEWTLVALGVVLGLVFNNRAWIGLLPVIGNLQYTLVIFRFKENEKALKISFLLSVVAFLIFNIAIYNFAGAIGDTVTIITTAVALLKGKKNEAADTKRETVEN